MTAKVQYGNVAAPQYLAVHWSPSLNLHHDIIFIHLPAINWQFRHISSSHVGQAFAVTSPSMWNLLRKDHIWMWCVQVWTTYKAGHQGGQRWQSSAAEDGLERWRRSWQGTPGHCRPYWGVFWLPVKFHSHQMHCSAAWHCLMPRSSMCCLASCESLLTPRCV